MAKKTVLVATLVASFLAIGAAPASAHRPHREGLRGDIGTSRLEALAHRLEGSVWQLQREAAHRIGHPSRREQKALGALRRLEKRADRFHARVERRPGEIRQLTGEFRALEESFRVAEAHLHRLHAPHLQRELGRVGVIVAELEGELRHGARIARHDGSRGVREYPWRSSHGVFAWGW